MKYFKPMLAVASCVLALGLTSCESNDSKVKYLPFRSSENGNWGMMTTEGKVLFEEEFKRKPTAPVNGRFFVVDKDGNYEIYTVEETPQKVGNKYIKVCPFTEDVTLAVEHDQKIKIIDKEGNEVATLDKAKGKNITSATTFHEGLSIIRTEDGCGCIDTKGNIVIEPIYSIIEACSEGIMLAITNKDLEDDNDVVTAIDKKGNKLFTIRKSKFWPNESQFKYGRLPVVYVPDDDSNDERKCGFINTKGEVMFELSKKYSDIIDWNDKTFIFSDGESQGLSDFDGTILLRPKYDNLSYAGHSLLWAETKGDNGSRYKLIDEEGKEVSSDSYRNVTKFFGKYAAVQVSEKRWVLIDNEGQEVEEVPDIREISQFDIDEAIYGQEDSHYCTRVYSDFLDVEAIIEAADITKDGCGVWTIKQTPPQIIRAWQAETENFETAVEPENFIGKDNLTYEMEAEGVDISFKVYYAWYMVYTNYESNGNSYIWATEKPKYVCVTFSGDKLEGKTSVLYSKLLSIAEGYGSIYKAGKTKALISIGSDSGIYLVDDGSSVMLRRYSNDSYKDFEDEIDD
jgi:hypothetical protein